MEVVRKLVGVGNAGPNGDASAAKEPEKVEMENEQSTAANGDESKADVAAEVADSAQKLDAEVEA